MHTAGLACSRLLLLLLLLLLLQPRTASVDQMDRLGYIDYLA